ncbi:hypothetical protein MLD63_14765 [Paracoccus sp. TK19116]|uniref:Secreted protein n=1 Tax=Paracoccus albicereus TaxID=2922394 RepID=A0ABT1MTN2_9RHOB|nr:hypothetical protein [Paracoccus albicereus]MCQ0971683.1 hypothetical protein [Paracoccus albicereus]
MQQPHDDDSREPGHEARVTSQTRFGPRPVPRPGLQPGTTEHDGKTMTSQLLVYGGIGIIAAAATTATVLATRKLAEAIAGNEDEPVARVRPRSAGMAPRFADLSSDEQEAVRRRVRAQAAADRERAARARAGASRRRDLAGDITGRANELTSSLNGVIASLTGAVAGFRSVAAQAGGIVREFSDTADVVRGVLGNVGNRTADPRSRTPSETRTRRPQDAADDLRADRMHRL